MSVVIMSVGIVALRGVIHFPLVNRQRQIVHEALRFPMATYSPFTRMHRSSLSYSIIMPQASWVRGSFFEVGEYGLLPSGGNP